MFARSYNFKKWYNKINLTILVKTRLEFLGVFSISYTVIKLI